MADAAMRAAASPGFDLAKVAPTTATMEIKSAPSPSVTTSPIPPSSAPPNAASPQFRVMQCQQTGIVNAPIKPAVDPIIPRIKAAILTVLTSLVDDATRNPGKRERFFVLSLCSAFGDSLFTSTWDAGILALNFKEKKNLVGRFV